MYTTILLVYFYTQDKDNLSAVQSMKQYNYCKQNRQKYLDARRNIEHTFASASARELSDRSLECWSWSGKIFYKIRSHRCTVMTWHFCIKPEVVWCSANGNGIGHNKNWLLSRLSQGKKSLHITERPCY